MQDSKLFQLFQALPRKEVLRLRKFLASPCNNKREDVVQLFEYLVAVGDAPTYSGAWDFVFPEAPEDLPELRRVMSYLQKLMDDYLCQCELRKDPGLCHTLRLKAYHKLRLDKPFRYGLNQFKLTLEKSSLRDAGHYYNQYQFHFARYNSIRERSGDVRPALQSMSDHLDTFFVLNKLKIACAGLTSTQLFGSEYQLDFLQEVIEKIESEGYRPIPAIGIYYNVYLTLHDPSRESAFFELKQQIQEHAELFEAEEIRSIYLLAINYCIKQINLGKGEFLGEVLDLYRYGLESEVIFESGQLSPWTYKNICSAGLKVRDFEWVDTFLHTYKNRVPESYRESFFHYNLAELKLARKDYQGVVALLNPVQFKDPISALNARITLIKAYFELQDSEGVETQLENFKQMLRRKENLTYHKAHYKNFIRFTRKLNNLKPLDSKGGKC
jgi:hypothetical protein